RRIIREEDPPKPSTRLGTMGEKITVISTHRHTEPKKLSQLVRGELDWIVMKALEKERARRYETANGLARDVERRLKDEAVQACPASAWYRFRKFAKRRKGALVVISAVAIGALLAVLTLVVSSVLVWRANDNLKQSLGRERDESYHQRIIVADRELTFSDNLHSARGVLEECPQDLRTWEWYYLMRLCSVEPLVIKDAREVTSVAFSPDGERLASSGADGFVKIWNSRTGQLIQSIKAHQGWAHSVAFHASGKFVVSSGQDKRFRVWDL